MKRLDVFLVEKGLARSRAHAQEKIQNGYIQVRSKSLDNLQWKIITKPSYMVSDLDSEVQESENPLNRFVSRAGLKLEGALDAFKLSIRGFEVLDVGASTGGFTDCCLQKGAQHVWALDVGHGQLCEKLKDNSRITLLEGINAKNTEELNLALGAQRFDLIVMDVSFISIKLILPRLVPLLRPEGTLLSLVKPQFELGPQALNSQGLVKSEKDYPRLEKEIQYALEQAGFRVEGWIESSIRGGDGNKEFFVLAKL